MHIKSFCFNPFSENTYILYNDALDGIVIDPGCSNTSERLELKRFISDTRITLKRLLLTHAHIDHILGLSFVAEQYGLLAELHSGELPVLESAEIVAKMYGVPYEKTQHSSVYLVDNQIITLGDANLTCILTPGHSPASLCFYNKEKNYVIGGDVLFEGSIGRTDLPGGNYETLITSIKTRLYPLGNEVMVYPGHGGATTIGQEKLTNPFLNS
ncbi:MAG: MBL fold metallo-hydrolase [Saprospiraceae bacterium]|jgi:glyoxylase-like metal-dependent hydrolase (beta-lactamase superfamily II)